MDEGERKVLWFMVLLLAFEMLLYPFIAGSIQALYPHRDVPVVAEWAFRMQFFPIVAYVVFYKWLWEKHLYPYFVKSRSSSNLPKLATPEEVAVKQETPPVQQAVDTYTAEPTKETDLYGE